MTFPFAGRLPTEDDYLQQAHSGQPPTDDDVATLFPQKIRKTQNMIDGVSNYTFYGLYFEMI